MGKIDLPDHAKHLCGLIFHNSIKVDTLYKALEDHFGPIDSASEVIAFNFTDYYSAEMGDGLKRQFVSFEETVAMDRLVETKLLADTIEKKWAHNSRRTVNIDPGYLTLYQIVLASTKKFYHRIYLKEGIYAEVTLRYRKHKGWTPFEWTFPDYRSEMASSYFSSLREIYKKQLQTPTKKV